MNETIEDIVEEIRADEKIKVWADRIEAVWKRERSQAKTASEYEYAIQVKFRGSWLISDVGFTSLDETKAVMKKKCRMSPNMEFRIVRRQDDWEVVE